MEKKEILKIKKKVCTAMDFLFLSACFYGACAFSALNINALEWGDAMRGVYMYMILVSAGIAYVRSNTRT